MNSANFERLVQCLIPEVAPDLVREMQERPDQFRIEFFGEGNPFRKVNGYRIAERTAVADDKVMLEIQVAWRGEVMPLPLHRVGNEWKVDISPGDQPPQP